MKTIAERAREYMVNLEDRNPHAEAWSFDVAYRHGAEDQKQIDIEKACEWLKQNSDTMYYIEGESSCEMAFYTADDMVACFREAMEGVY